MPPRMRSLVSLLRLLILPTLLCQAIHAQTEQDWSQSGTGIWRSKALSVGRFFQMGVNGQSTPFRTAMDAVDPPKTSKPRQDSEEDANSGTPPADARQSTLTFTAKPFDVVRVVKRDDKRNALMIVDTLTNTTNQDANLQLDYSTPLGSQGGVRFNGTLSQSGEMRDLGNGIPDRTHAAVIMAEKQGTPALPLLIWGQPDAKWPAVVQDVGSTLRLRYEGSVPANGKVAFLHWIGTAGLDPKVKLEKTFDLFLKDSKLVDPDVSAELVATVVNFKPDAFGTVSAPGAPVTGRSGKLVALDALTGKLDIKRGEKALLWMGKDEQISGDLSAGKVSIRTSGKDQEYPPDKIAAVRGGAGKGRAHRLYLRDGTVQSGTVSLQGVALKGELGDIALNAESLDLLVWPASAEDGRVPEGAAEFVQWLNGGFFWLGKGEASHLDLVAGFGTVKVSSEDLWTLQRKMEPPYCMVATLADGSRIHGVLAAAKLQREVLGAGITELPLAEVARWGAVEAALKEMSVGGEIKENASPTTGDVPTQYCWLRDGSLLVGTLGPEETIRLRTNTGELALKPDTVARVFWDAPGSNEAAIELTNGTKVRGEVLNDAFAWKMEKQAVSLPVGLITEVVRKAKP